MQDLKDLKDLKGQLEIKVLMVNKDHQDLLDQ